MEYTRVGSHELTVCPCCDKLFQTVATDDFSIAMMVLDEAFQQHLAESQNCYVYMQSLPSIEDVTEELRAGFAAVRAERIQRAADNPNNGTLGYWLVSGVRHEARTRASSAQEAIEKCSAVVQSWECPEAEFIGVELPDVF